MKSTEFINEEYVVAIHPDVEMYPDDMRRADELFANRGLTKNKDYQWNIAGGDDGANAITFAHRRKTKDKEIRGWIDDIKHPDF